jgi:hypothetical protein
LSKFATQYPAVFTFFATKEKISSAVSKIDNNFMKNLLAFLFSTKLMALLFVSLSVAMGVATFIENDYGTQTAKALVYNSWWFEAILGFFVVNFFGNIFRYRLYKKEKAAVLLFHLSFLFVLIGAAVTKASCPSKKEKRLERFFQNALTSKSLWTTTKTSVSSLTRSCCRHGEPTTILLKLISENKQLLLN